MKRIAVILPLLLVLSALAGLAMAAYCFPKGRNVEEGFATKTLYVTAPALDVLNDAQNCRLKGDLDLLRQAYEGLVRIDARTLNILPGVAESWDQSGDGLTYTFHLRRGLRWSDGSPLGASDFLAAAARALDPKSGVLRVRPFLQLKGARDYKLGKQQDFGSVGISMPEANTLVMVLEKANPGFLRELAGPGAWPLPRQGLGGSFADCVGNGPFAVEQVAAERVVLQRNPHYWDSTAPYLDRVVLLGGSSESNLLPLRYDSGQLHVATGLAGWVAARQRGRNDMFDTPNWSSFYLVFDVTKPPYDDPELRLALSLAVDRPNLAYTKQDSRGSVGWSIVPPMGLAYRQSVMLRDRAGEARALFEKVLARRKTVLPPFVICFLAGDETRQAALDVAQAWREKLGHPVEVRLKGLETEESDKDRAAVLIAGLAGSDMDPLAFLEAFNQGAGMWRRCWKDENFMRLLQEARREEAPEKRRELTRKAEEYLLEQAPVAPLFYGRNIYLLHPRIQNWCDNPFDMISYRDVRFAEEKP